MRGYIKLLNQSIKDWKFWTKLSIGSIQIASVVVFITISATIDGYIYAIPEHLSYFTTESNLFCGFFFIFSAIFHHNEGKGKFDNSEVAKIAMVYITLTIIIYNLDQIMSADAYSFSSWKYLMSFLCEHSVVPILGIIYYLFFYNHEKAKDIKEFSKKWVWLMILGLVIYLAVFSIIGEIAKAFNWKALYWRQINGSLRPTTFVYPFLDWYNGVGFFKSLKPWVECIVMLAATVIAATAADYCYTFIIVALKKDRSNKNHWHKNFEQKHEKKKQNLVTNKKNLQKFIKKQTQENCVCFFNSV